MKRPFLLLTHVLLMTALSSCTTATKITKTWKASSCSTYLQRVLIIGLAQDAPGRILFENQFVSELRDRGVLGYPSYAVFTTTGVPSEKQIEAAVEARGIGAILLVRLVEEKEVQTTVPGTAAAPPATLTDFYGAYSAGAVAVYSPGYTVENRVVVLRTELYYSAGGDPFWWATSATTTKAGNAAVIRSFIAALTQQMVKDDLIRD